MEGVRALVRGLAVGVTLAALAGCARGHAAARAARSAAGLGVSSTSTRRSVEQSLDRIEAELRDRRGQSIVTRLDHADAARSAGQRLPSTETLVFGDRESTARLLRRNQLAALDVPFTVLAWDEEASDQATEIVHSTPEYVASRFEFEGAPELDEVRTAFAELVTAGAGSGSTANVNAQTASPEQGVVTRRAQGSVPEAVARLEAAVSGAEGLSVVESVDLQSDARRAREELRPTTLVLFGAPAIGTRLMRARREVGLDLPQRMVIYENEDGETRVAYNDPRYLARRHGVRGEETAFSRLDRRLESLAEAAAGG